MVDATSEVANSGLEQVPPENGDAKFVAQMLAQLKAIDFQLAPFMDTKVGEHFDVQQASRVAVEDTQTGEITTHNVQAEDRRGFEVTIDPRTQRVYLLSYRKGNIGPRSKGLPDMHDLKYVDMSIFDRTLSQGVQEDDGRVKINPFMGVGNLDPQFSVWYGASETAVHVNPDGSKGSELEKEKLELTVDPMTDIGFELQEMRLRQAFVVRHLPERGGHWRGNEFIKEIHPPGFYPRELDFRPRNVSQQDSARIFMLGMNKAQSIVQQIAATETSAKIPQVT